MNTLPASEPPVNVNALPEVEQCRSERLAERETVIQYDDAGPLAQVFTCHRALVTQLLRRGLKPIRENRRGGRGESWFFQVPRSWLSIRPPRKLRLTMAQRQALSERASLLKNHELRPSQTSRIPPGKG